MALDRNHPFTRAEAVRAGMKLSELLGPNHVRLLHGVYLSSAVPITPRIRALAALRISDAGSWVSHHTAGALWGSWMPETSDIHVCAPNPNRRSIRRGIHAHRARAHARPVKLRGVWLSRPVDVFLDLAALHTDLIDLIAAGDALVKATTTEPEDLMQAAATWSGRGAKLARRAARYVRKGVDSVQETRLRMLLVLAGLPEPTVNAITRFDNGDWKWRFDLSYPELKILIEYDGKHHEESPQRRLDRLRREALEREGWLVVVVTRDDMYTEPADVLGRVRDALDERGHDGLRRRFATAWQRYFPSRGIAA